MEHLKAKKVIKLLESTASDKAQIKGYITSQASTSDIVNSLKLATDNHTQQILADIAGDRYEEVAVPMLIEYLQSASPGVRASAAEALGKIGDARAGATLMERFDRLEKDTGVRHMLATAVGACGYRAAIPLLIEALNDPDPVLRGCAAWGLGALGAESAEDALRNALRHEEDGFAKGRMQTALEAIVLVNQALQIQDRNLAIGNLILQLASGSQFTTTFVWALGKLGGKEVRKALIHTLVRHTGDKYIARRIEDALLSMEENSI